MSDDIIVAVKGHLFCTASREMANLIKSKVKNISITASANHSHTVSNDKIIMEECTATQCI